MISLHRNRTSGLTLLLQAATNNWKLYATGALFLGGSATAVAMLSDKFIAHASDNVLVPAQHPWNHNKAWESFDHAR